MDPKTLNYAHFDFFTPFLVCFEWSLFVGGCSWLNIRYRHISSLLAVAAHVFSTRPSRPPQLGPWHHKSNLTIWYLTLYMYRWIRGQCIGLDDWPQTLPASNKSSAKRRSFTGIAKKLIIQCVNLQSTKSQRLVAGLLGMSVNPKHTSLCIEFMLVTQIQSFIICSLFENSTSNIHVRAWFLTHVE